jgi:hypothetical protein
MNRAPPDAKIQERIAGYRQAAAEARKLADESALQDVKATLLRTAKAYDDMAETLEMLAKPRG